MDAAPKCGHYGDMTVAQQQNTAAAPRLRVGMLALVIGVALVLFAAGLLWAVKGSEVFFMLLSAGFAFCA